MIPIPFHIVTLTHPSWEEALACARRLPGDALPELRLDLFPELDPEVLVDALKRRCLVSCRRVSEGGRWPDADEAGRLAQLLRALPGRPQWVDLEWDLPVPAEVQAVRTHVRLLRSIHVGKGVFDLEDRLRTLSEGDAWKWVGVASRLGDNGRLRGPLAWARDRGLPLSAFLMGQKGIPSRALQAVWGGVFTYAAPDDGPPAAPGQLPLAILKAWRCARLHKGYGLCGVIGQPVLHSRGPAFHNSRFQRAFKDLVYLPLECGDAAEAVEALDDLGILGLSITAPLKHALPEALGLEGPLNTLWRRRVGDPWQGANTDAEAFGQFLSTLSPGPVLVLGEGGVASASLTVLKADGREVLQVGRRSPVPAGDVATFAPVGIIQATSLGMAADDPIPFPSLLAAAQPSLHWAVEWIYKEETAFAGWAQTAGLTLVEGRALFEAQAEIQSRHFVEGCGG